MTSSHASITFQEAWSGALEDGGAWFIAGMHIGIAIVVYRMTRQWLPLAKMAKIPFRTLQLPAPGNIDLVKSSKGRHIARDAFEFGAMYFRFRSVQ